VSAPTITLPDVADPFDVPLVRFLDVAREVAEDGEAPADMEADLAFARWYDSLPVADDDHPSAGYLAALDASGYFRDPTRESDLAFLWSDPQVTSLTPTLDAILSRVIAPTGTETIGAVSATVDAAYDLLCFSTPTDRSERAELAARRWCRDNGHSFLDEHDRATLTDDGDPDGDPEFTAAVAAEVFRRQVRSAADAEFASGARPIEFMSLTDLWEQPRVEWLADGFIQTATTTALSGAPGTGKSFVALDLACSVATGTKFLDRYATKQGRVLYLIGEGIAGIPARMKAWTTARGHRVPPTNFDAVNGGVSLSNPAHVDQLVDRVRGGGYSLVIVDTWAQLSGLESENDAAATSAALSALVRIRLAAPGCSVLIVHHVGKDESRGSRGSSAFLGNIDVSWILRSGDTFSLSSAVEHGGKMKDGSAQPITGLTLTDSRDSAVITADDGWVPARSGRRTQSADYLDRLREHFGSDRDFTTGEAVSQALSVLQISEPTAKRYLATLVQSGDLTQPERGMYRVGGNK